MGGRGCKSLIILGCWCDGSGLFQQHVWVFLENYINQWRNAGYRTSSTLRDLEGPPRFCFVLPQNLSLGFPNTPHLTERMLDRQADRYADRLRQTVRQTRVKILGCGLESNVRCFLLCRHTIILSGTFRHVPLNTYCTQELVSAVTWSQTSQRAHERIRW